MSKKTVAERQLWNNIHGDMRVWAKEFSMGKGKNKETFMCFSTSIGKKNESGEYDNLYYNVYFKKGEAPEVDEGAFTINIKKGFLTLSASKDGEIYPAVMVLDYKLLDEGNDEDEDNLPF